MIICREIVSPYPGIIGPPHLDDVRRPVEVHHIQSDDWVLLTGLNAANMETIKITYLAKILGMISSVVLRVKLCTFG